MQKSNTKIVQPLNTGSPCSCAGCALHKGALPHRRPHTSVYYGSLGAKAVKCHVLIKLAFYNNFKLIELFPNLQEFYGFVIAL